MKNNLFWIIVICLSHLIIAQTKYLPKWQEGFLDIHHINTGKGNATFFILPDGTTLLVDMGDFSSEGLDRKSPPNPNDSLSPAQWVYDYIKEFHPKKDKATLDYALLTHYHDDHMRHLKSAEKTHPQGRYKLSGITELGSLIKIGTLIDRGFDLPFNLKDTELQNKMNSEYSSLINRLKEYWKFIAYQEKVNGLQHQKIIVGSSQQIHLKYHSDDFPDFRVKNLFGGGEISNSWDNKVSIKKFKRR